MPYISDAIKLPNTAVIDMVQALHTYDTRDTLVLPVVMREFETLSFNTEYEALIQPY